MDEIGGKYIETLAVALAVRDMDTELNAIVYIKSEEMIQSVSKASSVFRLTDK